MLSLNALPDDWQGIRCVRMGTGSPYLRIPAAPSRPAWDRMYPTASAALITSAYFMSMSRSETLCEISIRSAQASPITPIL